MLICIYVLHPQVMQGDQEASKILPTRLLPNPRDINRKGQNFTLTEVQIALNSEKRRHRYILRGCLSAPKILIHNLGNCLVKDVFHFLICSLKVNIKHTGALPSTSLTLPKYEALDMESLPVITGRF